MNPKKLRALVEQVAASEREAQTILEGAAAREGDQRGLTDAEKTRVTSIKGDLFRLRPIVAEAMELVEAQREMAEAVAERTKKRRVVSADDPSVGPLRLADGRYGKFDSLGDYLVGMANTACAKVGRAIDGKIPDADARVLEVEATGNTGRATIDNPQDGSALTQLQYSSVLLTRAWDGGQVRSRCAVQDVGDGFDGVVLPWLDEKDRARGKRNGGIDISWAEDGVATTGTHVSGVKTMEMRVKPIRGLCRIPEKLLRDAAAVGSYMKRAFPSEYLYRIEDAILNGDGKGKPIGVLKSGVLISIAKEGGQKNNTVDSLNFIKGYARFAPQNISRSAILINRELLEQLPTLNIAIGTSGQLIYMPPGGLTGAPYGSIYGLPVIPAEQCPGAGQVGDALFFGGDEYLLALKAGGLQFAESMHFYFDTHDMAFRFEQELNGQPLLDGPIKPENAADANFRISPFVAFAKRAA